MAEDAKRLGLKTRDSLSNFCHEAFANRLTAAIYLVLAAVAFSVPIAMIIVGVIHKDDCPVESYIPLYLIVGGSVGMALVTLCIIYIGVYSYLKGVGRTFISRPFIAIIAVLAVFPFAWFICAHVWIDQTYDERQFTNSTLPTFCHKGTYRFVIGLISATYLAIVILIGLLGGSCTCTISLL